MRIRTIKPEFWLHEGICSCTEFARLLAIALLNWADDEGYFMANPILIRGQVFPFLDDSTKIPGSLFELSSVGWIELGKDSQGRDVGRIINFARHQRVDKPKPSTIKELSSFQDTSKKVPGSFLDVSEEEGKGIGMGKEGSGIGENAPSHAEELPMEPGKRMQILKTRINELDPSWKLRPHFTAKDDRNLFDNLTYISALEPESWQLMTEYLSLNLPDPPQGEPKYWQTRNRSQFLENIGDFFNHADRWKTNTQC